jgi:hypothetical protein
MSVFKSKSYLCQHTPLPSFLKKVLPAWLLETPPIFIAVISCTHIFGVADPGCLSRIRIFVLSPFRIPDPAKKEQGKNKLVVLPFFVENYLIF